MSVTLILGALFAIAGIIALLVLESKMIGVIITGVAGLFLVLNFYSDMTANTEAKNANFRATQAEFDRDFAKARNEDPKTQEELVKKAEALRAEAEKKEKDKSKVIDQNAQERKPLLDAVKSQVDKAAVESQKSTSSMTINP